MINKKLMGILLSATLVFSSIPAFGSAQKPDQQQTDLVDMIPVSAADGAEEPEAQSAEETDTSQAPDNEDDFSKTEKPAKDTAGSPSSETPAEDTDTSADNGEQPAPTPEETTPTVTPAEEQPVTPDDNQSGDSAEDGKDTSADSGEDGSADTKDSEGKEDSQKEEKKKLKKEKKAEEQTEETDSIALALAELQAASGSNDAGSSSVAETAKFVPGTYTVTANLYVPAELNTILGLNAYLTNPNNPVGVVEDNGAISNTAPTTPVSANATITIGDDGVTKILTIPVKNPVFTLQRIESGSNVTILDSSRNGNSYGNYSGRITSLTVNLGDNSGFYSFSNCLEYPTILEQDWTVPLYLAVDLACLPGDTKINMESGDGSTWEEGSLDSLSFIANEGIEKLEGVNVDGNALTKEQDYTAFAYQGLSYIDLNASYLGTLADGEHRLNLQYVDGFYATAVFTIKKNENKNDTDSGNKDPNQDPDKMPDKDDNKDNPSEDKWAAGTYQVTANLYLPGELNSQLPGTTAYLTNPSNPLGIGGHEGIPMTPVTDNATLVIGADGTKTVIVDVVNPVFTLQKITDGSNITVKSAIWDKETYTGVSQVESRTGRITKLYLQLGDDSGLYQFGDCTEFPTLLETDWNVPLQLSVNFESMIKLSDSTDTGLNFGDNNNNNNNGNNNPNKDPQKPDKDDKKDDSENPKKDDGNKDENTDPNAGEGTLKAGTYTVAANIWIDKASSGLPLNPYLTSSVFPPKDPVSNNATVTISESRNATVRVPIVIQSKVMSIKSISGLNIVDSSYSGGYLSSITVDLGVVTNPNAVITQSCTVSLNLGELAQTIAKKGKEQVWGATFQVNFSGIPSGGSGGGSVDVNALLAEAQNSDKAQTGTNIHFGIRQDTYSAAYLPLMEEHKNDVEIKETTDSSDTNNSGTDSNAAGSTQTEVKNSYLFKIEKLEENEENQALTEEEKGAKLSEQYLKHFADGTYDLVVVTPQEAESFCKMEDMNEKFLVLGMNEYQKKSEDATDVVDMETDSDTDVRLLLIAKSFVEKQESAVSDILKKVNASIETANSQPEQTAVSVISLGMGTDSASVQELLKENKAVLLTGKELQEAVNTLAGQEDRAELKAEGLCYDPTAKQTTDGTTDQTESGADTETSENESASSSEEKIAITDADSLSVALDAALAKKAEDGSDTDSTDGTINVSNSSNLDLDTEKAAAEALKPGTYTASVNLYLPGERNTQLSGTTAYMTNPDNPLGIGGHEGLPIVPAEANATLVVEEDGTKTITVDVLNPVFTLQKIAAPENSEILVAVKDSDRYEGTNGVGVDGRITQLVIRLGDNSALYPFDDCQEFPTLLETYWEVPLELSVEFTSAQKISDDTEVTIPEDTAGMATISE